MNLPAPDGEPVEISPSMNNGEFDVSWDVDAAGEAYRVTLYLSSTDSLEGAEKITGFNCDPSQGMFGGCDSEQYTQTCTFDQNSVVSCGGLEEANVLTALETDQLPAEGFLIFEAARVLSDKSDVTSSKIKFN